MSAVSIHRMFDSSAAVILLISWFVNPWLLKFSIDLCTIGFQVMRDFNILIAICSQYRFLNKSIIRVNKRIIDERCLVESFTCFRIVLKAGCYIRWSGISIYFIGILRRPSGLARIPPVMGKCFSQMKINVFAVHGRQKIAGLIFCLKIFKFNADLT